MKMFRWVGKVALVTGASSGIGRATAIALAEQGLKVVGVARRKEKLEEVEDRLKDVKGEFHPVPGDVSKESDILNVFDYIRSELNGVDVLINNAGVVYSELLINGRTENYRKILDVNVLAATICIREAIKSIQERSTEGHIVNINSIVGRYPTIGKAPFSIYQASKYALSAISEVARDEITHVKARVKVTNICPGLVHTDMAKNMTSNEKFFQKAPYIEAKDVVDAIVYTLGTPPNVQVTELVIVPQHFPPVKLMV